MSKVIRLEIKEDRRSSTESVRILRLHACYLKIRSKNADGSEGFIKAPMRRREAEPTFDFLLLYHL
jgi:hypothetical protein